MRSRRRKSGDRLIASPIKEPFEFIRAPFGKSVQEAVRDYIAEASEGIAMVTLIYEKYPWVLTKEDVAFLEETWRKLDKIVVYNENEKVEKRKRRLF